MDLQVDGKNFLYWRGNRMLLKTEMGSGEKESGTENTATIYIKILNGG